MDCDEEKIRGNNKLIKILEESRRLLRCGAIDQEQVTGLWNKYCSKEERI